MSTFPLSISNILGLILIIAGLYVTSFHDFLLFHSLAELFSIVIAFGIFIVAWNSRRIEKNHYMLFLGIAYLFIGFFDLAHTLTYKGIVVFHQDADTPTQFWIIARYLESLSLLIAPFFLARSFKISRVFTLFTFISGVLLLTVILNIFPACYVEGAGLTPFKRYSEYIIAALLTGAFFLLRQRKERLNRDIFLLLSASILLTIASEFFFTIYSSVFGIANIIGHLFKFISFYFIYKALVETGLRKPYEFLFRELQESEQKYRSLFSHMLNGFAYHKVVFDHNNVPVDYLFLEVNSAFEKMTGLRRQDIIGKKVTEVISGIRESEFDWIGEYGKIVVDGTSFTTEQYSESLNRWYSLSAYSPEYGYFAVIFEDITSRKRADQELREREWQFKSTFENAATGIAHLSLQGRFLLVNQRLCEILGYTPDELQEKTFQDITFPEDLTTNLAQTDRLMKGEIKNYSIEKRYIHKNGHLIWVNLTESVQLDDAGNPLYFIVVLEDVTKRKHAESALLESENKFRIIADSIKDVLWMSSPENRQIIYINPACEEVWGISRRDLYAKPQLFTAAVHPDDCAWLQNDDPFSAIYNFEGKSAFHYRIIRPDGTIRWIEDCRVPVYDEQGEMSLIVGIARDVTHRQNAELAREEHFRQITALMEELKRSNQDLQQFAYIASHDLQEPLRTVSSFVQLLKKRYQGKLDRKADVYINYAVSGTAHMQHLLQDLLSFSRIGGGELNLQSVELSLILDKVLQSLEQLIKQSGAEITCSSLPLVIADPMQINQLFQNLISNAIKFRGESKPLIDISAKHREGCLIIRVRDNGIGIEPKYLDRIFLIFQRLHRRDEYPGTGMGLAICKRIVERHGGRMYVESVPGTGSTFSFTIPDQPDRIVKSSTQLEEVYENSNRDYSAADSGSRSGPEFSGYE